MGFKGLQRRIRTEAWSGEALRIEFPYILKLRLANGLRYFRISLTEWASVLIKLCQSSWMGQSIFKIERLNKRASKNTMLLKRLSYILKNTSERKMSPVCSHILNAMECYSNTMKYDSTIKKPELLIHATVCWAKEARHKGLCTVWFLLYEIQEREINGDRK